MGIVVIGAVFVDIKGYPLSTYIPGGRNAGRIEQVHGGVSRNVAEDIANVELRPTFVGLVDDTGMGQDVIDKLDNHKVNTRYIQKVPDGMGTWLAIFDNDGDVHAAISKRPDTTPLTTLLLYTEILRHHKYETEAQEGEYLAKIDGKARQIKQLSDNLFEYALVTRDTVVQLDAPARFSQIFEEPLAEMVEMLQQRGFACALELGSEDVILTVRAQYIRRILDNIGSNLIKYADPARPIKVRFLRQEGRAGLVFRNHVLPAPPAVESTKVGLTSIETMMDKMHADCKIEQENEQFTMTLLFPVE